MPARGLQPGAQRGVVGVEAQADDVHRHIGEGDRDLAAGQVVQAEFARSLRRPVLAADLVVVGQGPQLDALLTGAPRQHLGLQCAVRDGRVAVEIGVEQVHGVSVRGRVARRPD